jgi:hypothetical protein
MLVPMHVCGLQPAETALRLNALAPDPWPTSIAVTNSRASELTDPTTSRDPLLRRAAAVSRHRAVACTAPADAHGPRAAGRRASLAAAVQTARMLAPMLDYMRPGPETDNFSETAVEIGLAAGQFEPARRWAEGTSNAQHWLALIDVADPAGAAGACRACGRSRTWLCGASDA